MSFIGNVPAEAYSPVAKDTFSGNGSTTDFTLSIPATTNSVEVFVENVQQEPTDAYTISGTTLSFTAAPVSGTDNIYVIHRGPAVQQVVPPAGVALSPSTVTATGDISTEGDLKVEVASGGIYTITGTDTASNRTLTLPDEAGTVLTSASDIVASQLPAGSVLQVVSDTFDTQTTITGTTAADTGISLSITPSSTSSKILILADVSHCGADSNYVFLEPVRNSTTLYQSSVSKTFQGSKITFAGQSANNDDLLMFNTNIVFEDSPSTTSSITYKIQGRVSSAGVSFAVNRRLHADDTASISSLTLMEIAG